MNNGSFRQLQWNHQPFMSPWSNIDLTDETQFVIEMCYLINEQRIMRCSFFFCHLSILKRISYIYQAIERIFMILFQDDWKKYPNAIADVLTTNTSFVKMASKLKAMGVKNYYFHLALMQPQLQRVDPFADNLTEEQQQMITLECQWNPWYFIREVLRVKNGDNPLMFEINRATLAFIWCFLVGIDFVLIMLRQKGKSVSADGIKIWLILFKLYKTSIFLYTKDVPLRAENVDRIKEMIKLLPKWLNPTRKDDADNTEYVTCKARDNKIVCSVAQDSEDRARNIGRGPTYPIVQVDEGPHCANSHISIPALLSATTTARDNAERFEQPYGVMYTNTCGRLDSDEGKYMHALTNSGMYWNEMLYDCADKYEARAMVRRHSKDGTCLVNGTFNHRQLGHTDSWLRDRIRLVRASIDEIFRDYLMRWTSGTDKSPISTVLNEAISNSEIEPVYVSLSKDKYMMRWYIPKDTIEQHLNTYSCTLGSDTGDLVGKDANTLVLVDNRDMGVIAASNITEANSNLYALWVADFLILYPKVTLVVEANRARAMLDIIIPRLIAAGMDPFTRVYNTVVNLADEKPEEYKELSVPLARRQTTIYQRLKRAFGFLTGGDSRKFLYSEVLQEACKSTGHLVRDKSLSEEIRGLVEKNGRIDHRPGAHDDLVIAWLLCQWFVRHGKNLKHYGIKTSECLSMVSSDGAVLKDEDIDKRRKITVLNVKISNLKELLVSAPTIIETMRYERELKHTVRLVNELGDTTVTLDAIMTDIRENKITGRKLRDELAVLQRLKPR